MSALEIYTFLIYLGQFLKNWWWVFLPFILWKPFLFLYLWWRIDLWLAKQRWIIFEIKLPKEILKPIRAMETVMASMHGAVFHPPDYWEMWIDGQVQLSLAFEIASIDGETHFFVRTPVSYRDSVESSLYSQYPEAEIQEVEDYTKYVPQNLPNADWNMWATDYRMIRDDHYPIKTYPKFETEHEVEEEKIVDPVATLLEGMSKIKVGEQFLIQILAEPVADAKETGDQLTAWLNKGQIIRDKLARRPEAPQMKPIIQEAAGILITGKVPEEEEKKEEIIPPEMKLTPGEREIITGLEEKMTKPIFKCGIRFIYLGKRDVFFKPNFRLGFSFLNSYTTTNLNAIVPWGQTITKIHKSFFLPYNVFEKRRLYLRCRKLLRNYVRRLTALFPRPPGNGGFMLTTEELASIFHFPGRASAPGPSVSRIEAKKGGVPSELPIE